MPRIVATAVLSLLVLLSQQAAMQHGLAHLARDAEAVQRVRAGQAMALNISHDVSGEHEGGDGLAPCKNCLAFAQVADVIDAAVAPPALLCGMLFHAGAARVPELRTAACPAKRSRSPPFLV